MVWVELLVKTNFLSLRVKTIRPQSITGSHDFTNTVLASQQLKVWVQVLPGDSTGGSYTVRAAGAECRAVLKHPLMPAGTGLILPQMEAGNMGVPDGAAWMCHAHPGQNSSFDSSLFMHFSLTFTLGKTEARERVGAT